MQRSAGNQAVSELLRTMTPDSAPSVDVSTDTSAEAEADRVADEAVLRMGADVHKSPVDGNAIAPELRRAIGAVAPNIGATSDIRVRTDSVANEAADAFGARAYTSGRDVAVARGELDHGVEAHRLVAHEAVHAAQHQPAAAGNVVHAKLRGTHEALVAKGGGQTSGKLRKLVHSKTNWDKICDAVGAYEELEAAALKGGNPKPNEMQKITPKLLGQLTKIESACAAWEKANKSDANDKREAAHKKFKDEGEMAESDPRDKAERRQAIAMLLPRVRLEIADLQGGRWTQSMGLSDSKKTDEKGKQSEGQVNKVEELHYATESGKFSGYFKEEKGFANKNFQGHEANVGIHQMDPNYGARTVAMYRLDQLLGADVTAKAEFAVHDGKLGTVLESAKGEEAVNVKWAMDEDQQKERGPGSVLTSDPVLQKAMNKLQIFDAICGQLDRHQGNWYVDMDPKTGKVRGIKGIDLDMAFGSEHEDPNQIHGENYLGLPPMMDAAFANRLLLILPNDIRGALRGLLSEAEVEATVRRFTGVQAAIRKAANENKLVDKWDEKTAEENRSKDSTMRSGQKTYASQMAANAVDEVLPRIKKAVASALSGEETFGFFNSNLLYQFEDMPDLSSKGIKAELQYEIGYLYPKKYVLGGQVRPGQGIEWAMETLNELLGDSTYMAKTEISIQEMDGSKLLNNVIAPLMAARIEEFLKKWLVTKSKVKQKV